MDKTTISREFVAGALAMEFDHYASVERQYRKLMRDTLPRPRLGNPLPTEYRRFRDEARRAQGKKELVMSIAADLGVDDLVEKMREADLVTA